MRSIGRRRDDVPVDHRLPRHHADQHLRTPALRVGMRAEIGLQLGLGRQQSIDRHRRDRLSGGPTPSCSASRWPTRSRSRGRDHVMSRAALGDGAPEQPGGAGHGQQRADAHRPGRLAEDGDVAGIAAEGADVVPHPLQRGDLVEQAAIGVSVAEIEEPIGADPVVDGHADDAVAGETAAVIPGRRTRAVIREHPARDPHHHRLPGRPEVGRPDVEGQAVLAGSASSGGSSSRDLRGVGRLGGLRAVGERVAHAAPGLQPVVGAEADWRRMAEPRRECP